MSFTDELSDVNRALAMLKTYSVEPASQPEGYSRGDTKIFKDNANDFAGFRHEVVSSTMRKAWVELTENTAHNIRVGGTGAAGTLVVKANVAQTNGWAPTYYLPWDHRGAAVEMTIPQSNSNDLNTHPQIFFTTALSGCSIIFKGTQQSPTVYHCGSQDKALAYDANRFWEDFVNYIDQRQSTKTPGSNFANPVGTQAKKNMYVSGVNDPNAEVIRGSRGTQTTATALAFRNEIAQRYGNQVAIEQAIPWGAVFGLRRGQNWTFYLQENVNLIFYTQKQVEVVKTFLGITTDRRTIWQKAGQPKIVSRPMIVREVFPNGAGAPIPNATFRDLVREAT